MSFMDNPCVIKKILQKLGHGWDGTGLLSGGV
jgi:hypothetical protein